MSRVHKSIRSTHQILKGSNHILHSLFAQSRELSVIQEIVNRHVQVENAVASFKNNELTLVTPKSTLATQIRYRQRNIISALRRSGLDVSLLKIRIQPIFTPKKPEDSERYLSVGNSMQIAQTAAHIEDADLKQALLNLSRRTRFPGTSSD